MSQTPRRQQGRSGRKSEGCGLGDPRQGALPRLVLSSVWSTVEQSNTTDLRPERAPGAGSACRTGEVWWEILEDVAQARENRLCSCPRGTGCVSSWSQLQVQHSGPRPCSSKACVSSSGSFSHPREQAGASPRDSFARASVSNHRSEQHENTCYVNVSASGFSAIWTL